MQVSTSFGSELTFAADFSTAQWSGECRLTIGTDFRSYQILPIASFDAMAGALSSGVRSSLRIGNRELTIFGGRAPVVDLVPPSGEPGVSKPSGSEIAAIGAVYGESTVTYAFFYGTAATDRAIAKHFHGPVFEQKKKGLVIRNDQTAQVSAERYFVLERGVGLFRVMKASHARALVPNEKGRKIRELEVWRLPSKSGQPTPDTNFVVASPTAVSVFSPDDPSDASVEKSISSVAMTWL
jgi:hypothetical protein